ncbi:Ripening-related protein grip22 [Zea mays]|uniref:Ripening-related protein grip22 n=1 Tax=Zea mays TaxID=4577 RepID=A0A1D6KQF8_MAIZE|nr:Ripening-related protein grip22 [Zea mays]
MANTKIAVAIAILLALLQVSCAAARRHGKPAHGDHDGNGTPAVMTVNGFERGEDGGGAASCDGSFHSDDKLIVALSSRWYAGGKRCGEAIRITAESGRNREGTGRGRVQVLDSSNLGLIKPDTLVRYRGMVQDMLGNEYYIGAFKVSENGHGNSSFSNKPKEGDVHVSSSSTEVAGTIPEMNGGDHHIPGSSFSCLVKIYDMLGSKYFTAGAL